MLIGGNWVDSASGEVLEVEDPAHRRPVAEVPPRERPRRRARSASRGRHVCDLDQVGAPRFTAEGTKLSLTASFQACERNEFWGAAGWPRQVHQEAKRLLAKFK